MEKSKKVSLHTLGCKLNFSETSTVARMFTEEGYTRVREDADICVINTCSVTEHADKKCRNLIRQLIRKNPGAIIAVTGCYAQLKPGDIASIEGVDLVLGNNDKGELYNRVSALSGKGKAVVHACDSEDITGFFASFSSSDRTRSFLKVQDGCSYKCSYCTIPYARGQSRNISIDEIVKEARHIGSSGIKEIILTGINTGDFGRSTGESFAELLRSLSRVETIERYRISSIEPNLLTDEVISVCVESGKFQPHFHIPLQNGSDRILGLMRRRYNTSLFRDRIRAVRKAMGDVFLGIDIITGFPGETQDDFEMTYNFLREISPAWLHVFPYSERPGTPAAGFPDKVQPAISRARVKRLTELSGILYNDYCERLKGTEAHVLYESTLKGGRMMGYTGNYIKVSATYEREYINTIRRVRLGQMRDDGTVEAVGIE